MAPILFMNIRWNCNFFIEMCKWADTKKDVELNKLCVGKMFGLWKIKKTPYDDPQMNESEK